MRERITFYNKIKMFGFITHIVVNEKFINSWFIEFWIMYTQYSRRIVLSRSWSVLLCWELRWVCDWQTIWTYPLSLYLGITLILYVPVYGFDAVDDDLFYVIRFPNFHGTFCSRWIEIILKILLTFKQLAYSTRTYPQRELWSIENLSVYHSQRYIYIRRRPIFYWDH